MNLNKHKFNTLILLKNTLILLNNELNFSYFTMAIFQIRYFNIFSEFDIYYLNYVIVCHLITSQLILNKNVFIIQHLNQLA